MKRFLKSLLTVVVAIIVFLIGFLWYAGFFEKVFITEKETGPYYALVAEVGFYEDPVNVRNRLFNALKAEDIMGEKAVAISEHPFRENLITKTGWLVDNKDVQLAERINPDFEIIQIPQEKRIVADFPYNNSFSIMSGSYIVYRRLLQYANQKNMETGKIYEVYDNTEDRIFYHLNIKKERLDTQQ